jgi:hypothetical protein
MFRVADSRRPTGAPGVLGLSQWPLVTAQAGSDLLLRLAAFSAWRFSNLFPIRMREHIAGLTL